MKVLRFALLLIILSFTTEMFVRKHYIIIGNRRHGYTLTPARKLTMLVCKSADIAERFPNDEIPQILAELPRIIIEKRQSPEESQAEVMRFRVSASEKVAIEINAFTGGYDTVSAYLRDIALRGAERELSAHDE